MLSVSTAAVHRTIRPKTPESSPSPPSVGRKDRHLWNCEYTVFPKGRFRQSSARKKIISNDHEDATIGIDVHCQTVRFDHDSLESSIVDSANEVIADVSENSVNNVSSQRLQRISQQPIEELSSMEENYRISNPIPFVKGASMQRNKTPRNRDNESIEKIDKIEESFDAEKPLNSDLSVGISNNESNDSNVVLPESKLNEKKTQSIFDLKSNLDNVEKQKTQSDFKVIVLEAQYEDDDMESIFDAVRLKSKKTDESTSKTEKNTKKIQSTEKITQPVVLSSRMLRAQDLLKTPITYDCQNTEECSNDGVPGIPGDDAKMNSNNFPSLTDNGWDSNDVGLLQNPLDDNSVTGVDHHEGMGNRHFMDVSEPNDDSLPYYMIGFPNPLGENRCWLNATLHAMFALPLIDHLENLGPEALRSVSDLTKTFMALRLFWSKGKELKPRTYQTIKTLKESLGILDESYPSQRQQDVSEFLTMFLNYLKTDFEKITSRIGANNLANKCEEAENIPENIQNNRIVTRSPQTPTKRPPLADISPRKRKYTETGSDSSGEYSPKSRKITYGVQDLLSPRVNRLSRPTDPSYKVHTPPHHQGNGIQRPKENADFCKNPIDRYFLLHMMEHYDCKSCAKHRQRKVDNLMLYVDLPPGSENHTVSLQEAVKRSLEPEERDLICSKCKHDKHKVYTTFRACPKILMVQVNRYGMCDDGSVAKFNTPVQIPEHLELDLGASDAENGNGIKESFVPVCVIAHVGSAMDCGHYTSYVEHGDSWYHYNDLSVTSMSRYEALAAAQTTAYVVFFVSSRL